MQHLSSTKIFVGLALLASTFGCGNDEAKPAAGGGGSGAAASGGSEPSGGSGATGASGGTQGGSGASAGAAGTATGGESSGGVSGSPSGGADAGGTDTGGESGAATGGSSMGGTTSGAGGDAGGGGAGAGAGNAGAGGQVTTPAFETRTLATDHVAEGADAADIDGDGVIDLVAGPRWYKGPDYALGGTVIADPPTFTRDQYSTFFLTFAEDVNGDMRPDVVAIGDAGGGNGSGNPNAFWYQNPGPTGLTSAWTRTAIYSGLVSNESPMLVNLTGNAERELVFMTNRQLGYAQRGSSATAAWTFTAVTGSSFNTPYVHGLGSGDIDGDGSTDLVERSGWWRQVAGSTWEQHSADFGVGLTGTRPGNWGGAQMAVFDVDGDGDNDVVTALAAHGYGLAWFENEGTGSARTFTAHEILPATAGGDSFSQPHALVVADVNGDGLSDFIAGKRYYAHPSSNKDPGTDDGAVLYWFELRRSGGSASFVPHLVHGDSGAGCNFVARDLTGDGKIDVFTTNKRGTFLHVQR